MLFRSLTEEVRKNAQEKVGDSFAIWERFCIENYILDPVVIERVINDYQKRKNRSAMSPSVVAETLDLCYEAVRDETQSHFIGASHDLIRRLNLNYTREQVDAMATTFITKRLTEKATLPRSVSGKSVLGRLITELQKNHDVSFRPLDLIANMKPEEVPADVISLFDRLKSL